MCACCDDWSVARHVHNWQTQFDVKLFSYQVSATGMAELFWPRAHVDKDDWYTVLVILDLGELLPPALALLHHMLHKTHIS